jgi:RND family efflux transporter MFP subunit
MKKLSLPIVILFAVILVSCKKESKPEAINNEDEAAIAVKLAPVQQGEYVLPIISSGLITTSTEAKLSFKVGGIIATILVEEGQSVTKGQLLASLDLTEINAQVVQAKNNLEKTKRDLDRVKRLQADSAATLEQVQNATTAYDVAKESFTIANFARQYAEIRAITSGKVLKKYVNEGELINSGTAVLLINSAAQNEWIVKTGLADVDWVRVKKGDKATVTSDAYPGIVFNATVSLVSEGAEVVNGLYLTEVKINNSSSEKFASGLFANVKITPSQQQQLSTVPIEAVIEGQGKNAFVFVVNADGKTVKKQPIVVAYLENNQAFISSGLEQTTEVVTGGSAFLTEYSTVKIAR